MKGLQNLREVESEIVEDQTVEFKTSGSPIVKRK